MIAEIGSAAKPIRLFARGAGTKKGDLEAAGCGSLRPHYSCPKKRSHATAFPRKSLGSFAGYRTIRTFVWPRNLDNDYESDEEGN